jgi:hypothetical protein
MPTEKYVHGPEIRTHCQRIGRQFGLYDDALFHTEVTRLTWDEARTRWVIEASRGDQLTAQFVVLGTGPLSVPKLPGIPGIARPACSMGWSSGNDGGRRPFRARAPGFRPRSGGENAVQCAQCRRQAGGADGAESDQEA